MCNFSIHLINFSSWKKSGSRREGIWIWWTSEENYI